MARLQLSERELFALRASLAAAVDGTCVPDWEFESLIGCTRGRARHSLQAALRRLERGERPADSVCERMVLLLSAALGASPDRADDIAPLIERFTTQDRSPLESGIAFRGELVPRVRARRA